MKIIDFAELDEKVARNTKNSPLLMVLSKLSTPFCNLFCTLSIGDIPMFRVKSWND
jgi:hypothetical protein